MRAQSIYNMFCMYCYELKDEVSEFKSYGNDAILIFLKKHNKPLVFTVINANRGIWTLGPIVK